MLLLMLGVAAPAAAEDAAPLSGLGPDEAPLNVKHRGFAFPVVDYTGPTGETRQRRGILVGKQLAPGTLVGLGFFESAPRMRGYAPEAATGGSAKRKRRVAVGLTMRF